MLNNARSAQERAAFSHRLTLALDAAGAPWANAGSTALSRQFNLIYPAGPVTVHAARKWLVGEAIPTQDKLRALAAALGVSHQWLRFGDDAQPVDDGLAAAERMLVIEYRALAPAAQAIVRRLIRDLKKST